MIENMKCGINHARAVNCFIIDFIVIRVIMALYKVKLHVLKSFDIAYPLGQLTPAQTLDLMTTNNHIMIDIRSEKDKDKAGIPRLPSDATNRMVAIP